MRAFWHIFQEQDCSPYRICAGPQQNIKNFHYRKNSGKLMTKVFFKFEKSYFWPISPIFAAKQGFPKNLDSVMHHFIMVSIIMPKFREI